MGRFRKIVSLLLASAMILTCNGISVMAAEVGGIIVDNTAEVTTADDDSVSVVEESSEIITEIVSTEIEQEQDGSESIEADSDVPDTDEDEQDDILEDSYGDYEYSANGNEATITKYKGTETTINVPNSLDGYVVTKIGSYAFQNNTTVESVSIPSSIKTIDYYAFSGCSALSSVDLSKVETINYNAFYNCSSLTDITIPKTVTSIGTNAFNKVVNVTFEDGMETIPQYALYYATALTNVVIPSSVTKIGYEAFYGCTSLTSIDLKNVTELGNYAFYGCTSLATVKSDSVTKFGNYAFYGCTNLSDINISKAESIDYYAFNNCEKITEITIPKTLSTVGSGAFNKVTKVIFEEGITKIPGSIMNGSTLLTEVVIPSTVEEIGSSAFNGCTALSSIDLKNTKIIGSYAFYNCKELTSVNLSKVENIEYYAFYNCEKITEITVSNTLEKVGSYVFNKVTKVIFEDGMKKIPDGIMQGASGLTEIILPDTVTEIGRNAFDGCSSLASFDLSNIEKIEPYAFQGCKSLENIDISSVKEIGSYAFSNCSLLTEIVIPKTLEKIDYNAFNTVKKAVFEEGTEKILDKCMYYATSLEEVVIPDSVKEIGEYSFYYCSKLTEIDINNVEKIGYYAFASCQVLENIDTKKLKSIGSYAFNGDKKLKKIVLPDGVDIGNYAFYTYSLSTGEGLEEIIIGKDAKIGTYAFSGQKNVRKLSIGSGAEIADYAFKDVNIIGTMNDSINWKVDIEGKRLVVEGSGEMPSYEKAEDVPWSGCNSLFNHIFIDDGITSICDYAFKGNTNIVSVVLGENIKTIGREAFSGCTSLRYIEIPERCIEIGQMAFNGCTSLKTIVFSGDAPTIGKDAFPNLRGTVIWYPETATGYTERLINKFSQITFTRWDNTKPSHDVVLVLDRSGSMGTTKMNALIDATSQFIYGVGGKVNNTRVAVVDYDSTATLLCDFTSDVSYLAEKVAELTSRGGTEYHKALTKADEVMQTSHADYKTLIMFSDGEPNDSKDKIYEKAEELRDVKKYNMFTVGFIDSGSYGDSYREVLINVAGRIDHYFEANDVDALVQAFLDLVEGITKKDDTTVEIKRHSDRVDILTSTQRFCTESPESISIIVTPGTTGGEIKKITIEQGGQVLYSNESGVFENILPGYVFAIGQTVYAKLYDSRGNLVESLDLGIEMCESFEITYMMNDGTSAAYLVDEFKGGVDIRRPDTNPEREGYKFVDWYTDKECSGMPFFSSNNYDNRLRIEDDKRLYAKWKKADTTFDVDEDAYHFTNSDTYFNCFEYEMSSGDFQKLMAACGSNESLKSSIKVSKEAKPNGWGGSCFGMSSSAVLIKDQTININAFDPKAFVTAAAKITNNSNGDSDVGAVESMINYYMLMQMVGQINAGRSYSNTESVNIKKILDKMSNSGKPVVFGLRLDRGGVPQGGHAVVAFDYKDNQDDTYSFKIWDCSLGYDMEHVYPVTVTKTGSTYTKECSEWEDEWGYNIFFKYALTADDLKKEQLLIEPSVITDNKSGEPLPDATEYELTTNYPSFVVTDGINSAVIAGGLKSSGSLDIECLGNSGEINTGAMYLFRLPVLSDGATYTITKQSGGSSDYMTQISFAHSTKGFYDFVNSDKAAFADGEYVSFNSLGDVKTLYLTDARQSIVATKTNTKTPWYYISFEGTNKGYEAALTDESAQIKSVEAGTINITVEGDINSLSFEDVEIDSTGIEIVQGESSADCIIKKGESEIDRKDFGYSVVFDSQLGSPVATKFNVVAGSTIEEPNDPRRPGYIFEGWFKDSECTIMWDFDKDTVTENTTLYGGWSFDANYFVTVTFNMGGTDTESIYVAKGNKIDINDCPVIKPELDQNWYVQDDYTNPWNFATDEVINNMRLYAVGDPYTVTFETNSSIVIDPISVNAGMRITEPVMPERDGYTFAGWYHDADFAKEWRFKKDRIISDTTVYARWIENERDLNSVDTKISVELINPTGIKYTGKGLTPRVIVREGGKILTAGKDYKITYKNNVNSYDVISENRLPKTKWPQYTIQGIGAFKSQKAIVKYFTIYKADMAEQKLTVPDSVEVKKNDAKQKVSATVSGTRKLGGKEFTVSYYKDRACTQPVECITTAGVYYVVAEAAKDALGNYSGNYFGKTAPEKVVVATKDKMISKGSVTNIKKIKVMDNPDTETAIASVITKVKVGSTEYRTDSTAISQFMKDLKVIAVDVESGEVFKQENLGKALSTRGQKKITVLPSDDNPAEYAGSKTVTVTVDGTPINRNMFVLTYADAKSIVKASADYTGQNNRPNLFTKVTLDPENDFKVTYKMGNKEVASNELINAGNYSIVITGINKYQGKVTIPFTINKIDLAKGIKGDNVLINATASSAAIYSNSGAKPKVSVSYDADGGAGNTFGREMLIEGLDYKLSYGNNKVISSYNKKGFVSVTGIGNFKGTIKGDGKSSQNTSSTRNGITNKLNFDVNRKSFITAASDFDFVVTGLVKKNRSKTYNSANVSVYDNGKKLGGNQYNVTAYESSGKVRVTISGKNLYTGSKTIDCDPTLINLTAKTPGVDIKLASDSKIYYTGERITPEIVVTNKKTGENMAEYVEITYGENTNIGNGVIYVRGIPEKGYCGEKTFKFVILPKWMKWLF